MQDNLWKMLTIGLLSCSITGFTSWITFGLSRVSEADMTTYVSKEIQAEILKDKTPHVLAIQRLEDKTDSIIKEIKEVKEALNKIGDRNNAKSN